MHPYTFTLILGNWASGLCQHWFVLCHFCTWFSRRLAYFHFSKLSGTGLHLLRTGSLNVNKCPEKLVFFSTALETSLLTNQIPRLQWCDVRVSQHPCKKRTCRILIQLVTYDHNLWVTFSVFWCHVVLNPGSTIMVWKPQLSGIQYLFITRLSIHVATRPDRNMKTTEIWRKLSERKDRCFLFCKCAFVWKAVAHEHKKSCWCV